VAFLFGVSLNKDGSPEVKMTILRTPDERFEALPDFPFRPHYVDINGMRIHYVDEGKGRWFCVCMGSHRGRFCTAR
jgi:hypothetical protein